MKRVKISDNLTFSGVAQGFWRTTKTWDTGTDEILKVMKNCLDLGVTTFDTAEVYGNTECEKIMGAAFKKDPSIRKKAEVVSKTGITLDNGFGYYDTTYDRIINSCKASLKRLETDYLDLYLIHRPDPLADYEEIGRALMELKRDGLVREIGVSNFNPIQMQTLMKYTNNELVTNQIEWSPLCFEHFDSGMTDYLTGEKIRPMIWSPLAGGRIFTGEDEICKKAYAKISEIAEKHDTIPDTIVYAWIMYHPMRAVPICGSNKADRLKAAVDACNIMLTRREWFEIYAACGQKIK